MVSRSSDGIVPAPVEIMERLAGVFDDDLLGAYLYGSATHGGLRRHSDVDVLGVLGRRTNEDERRQLRDLMLEISGARARRGPARPVELTLVVQDDVRPWRYPPRSEFQYGEWLRDEYESGAVPSPVDSPDVAILLLQARTTGVSLFGPAPDVLLDPVPERDLRRAMIDSLPELLADLETDRNVVLTLSRVWMTLETGLIESKDVAADWALERLPACLRAPLARARAWYVGDAPEQDLDLPSIRAFAAYAVRQVRGAYRRQAAQPLATRFVSTLPK